jgi:hypothetical protein
LLQAGSLKNSTIKPAAPIILEMHEENPVRAVVARRSAARNVVGFSICAFAPVAFLRNPEIFLYGKHALNIARARAYAYSL